MVKYCFMLCCLLLSVSAIPAHNAAEPEYYKLTWEFDWWLHANSELCAFNPVSNQSNPPRVVSAFTDADAEYWELGSFTPIPIAPSGAAVGCAVSTMQLQGSSQPSLCFGLAVPSANDSCKIYCDYLETPMPFFEWSCGDAAKTIGMQHFTGFTLVAVVDQSGPEIELLCQYDGEEALTPVQTLTGWKAPHEVSFLSHEVYPFLEQSYLVVADINGDQGGFGNLVIMPLAPNCGGVTGAMFTAREPSARNVILMEGYDGLLIYLGLDAKPFVAVYRFDGARLVRINQINTPQANTLGIAICKNQLFVGGTGGDVNVYLLDQQGMSFPWDVLPAPQTTGIAAYLDEQDRCQVTIAARCGGAAPHYQEKPLY